MSAPQVFQSRIVGHDDVDPEQLVANPKNWRIHPRGQQDALEGALSEVGWVQGIVVNRRTGYVVDGHARVTLALRNGDATVPVTYVDLSEEEEALVLATLDPIGAMAVADTHLLGELLEGVRTTNDDLQALLNDLALGQHSAVPSLDDLESRYGEYDESAAWPEIRLRVSPDTYEQYESVMRLAPGDTDDARLSAVLSACDTTLLGE